MPLSSAIGVKSGGPADDGREELVSNEEPPARLSAGAGSVSAGSVPVLYYTTAGGRSGEEVAIVTNSVGGQFILSPSGRPDDLDPKHRAVTEELLARLRCFTITAMVLAPLIGIFVLISFLRCRRAFFMANGGGRAGLDVGSCRLKASLWARRTEKLFILSIFCLLAELVVVLLAVEYHLRLNGTLVYGL